MEEECVGVGHDNGNISITIDKQHYITLDLL